MSQLSGGSERGKRGKEETKKKEAEAYLQVALNVARVDKRHRHKEAGADELGKARPGEADLGGGRRGIPDGWP